MNIAGGLGNQMFQYACSIALSKMTGQTVYFSTDLLEHYNDHNGFELEKVFDITLAKASQKDVRNMLGVLRSPAISRRLLAKKSLKPFRSSNFLLDTDYEDMNSLCKDIKQNTYLQGYWQNESFFYKEKQEVLNAFSIKKKPNSENLSLLNEIEKSESVAIHIRRGDYVNNPKTLKFHGICSLDYYKDSMAYILDQKPNASFYIFSDDHNWVNENIVKNKNNMRLVTHNKGENSCWDLFLMSKCKNIITANSTFSWWAAWLNQNPNGTIIAPLKWFNAQKEPNNFIPKNWIRL